MSPIDTSVSDLSGLDDAEACDQDAGAGAGVEFSTEAIHVCYPSLVY
jgi:hypothetical protein